MLTGKIALVTGAARGIGREIALTFAREGADVIVNYQGSKQLAEEVADQIRAMGRKSIACLCNVADKEAVEKMIKDCVEEFGKIDIVVNNAGITKDNLIIKMTEQDFSDVIDVNLKGTFQVIKQAARPMIRQRSGRIINIASVSGVLGNPGQANYSASKAGVIGLTKTMARELAGRGITVNALAPGFIETDMTKDLSETIREKAVAGIPLGRFGKTKDIAEMAAFLASDKGDYITGQVISIDGGMAM